CRRQKCHLDPSLSLRMRFLTSSTISNYDYTSDGYYYITICSNYKRDFSEQEKQIILKYIEEIEKIAEGVRLDFYEIVHNHLHMILILNNCRMNLGEIIRRFKALVSKEVKQKLWQPNYYEHIIRNEKALNKIREYIKNNPLKEQLDLREIYE
ncbi:MAG: transposase, partial [Endomicrobiia bacterium]